MSEKRPDSLRQADLQIEQYEKTAAGNAYFVPVSQWERAIQCYNACQGIELDAISEALSICDWVRCLIEQGGCPGQPTLNRIKNVLAKTQPMPRVVLKSLNSISESS